MRSNSIENNSILSLSKDAEGPHISILSLSKDEHMSIMSTPILSTALSLPKGPSKDGED